MNAAKFTLTSTILAAALGLALGLATAPAMADKPVEGVDHNHGDEDPDPTLGMCTDPPCIADVGKASDDTPAKQFAEQQVPQGTYTKIASSDFDKILETLMEGEPATALCDALDVLIFNWNSPRIKNWNWERVVDYMACGGGVIVEDPRNVGALAAGVSTIEVTLHSKDEFPLLITLLPSPPPPDEEGPNDNTEPIDLNFVNKHIIFDNTQPVSEVTLIPFLCLASCTPSQEVVGLYGELERDGRGRIVLTGLDNNFHGRVDGDDARMNHYDLLFNEINWLLE